jgi:hypothetical protein
MEGTTARWPHPRARLLVPGLLVVLAACGSTRRSPILPEPVRAEAPTPAWIHQPLSWDKLDAIAAWLERSGTYHDPGLVIEGQLQLNEGWVLFTDQDLQAERIQPELVRTRAARALTGFESVLTNPTASTLQLQRAELGKRAAEALLDRRSALTQGPRVVTRTQWGAAPASAQRMTPVGARWQRITVHHSAESASPVAAGSLADSTNALRLIQKYHMQDASHRWGDIGYHFLIDSSGRVFQGRELAWQGAHAGGANNRANIGICLLGDFRSTRPSEAATASLDLLIQQLRVTHGIPAGAVLAHNQLGGTECPGPWLSRYLARYR